MKKFLFTASAFAVLAACNGDGINPLFAEREDGTIENLQEGDNTTTDNRFLYDTNRSLTLNEFAYDETTDTVTVNNLPFDGNDTTGPGYTNSGVTLPNGAEIFVNAPNAAEDQYYAVVLRTPAGQNSLVGVLATNAWADPGYGGAFASRESSGLPPAQPSTYIYTGDYAGLRVIRQGGGGAAYNAVQTVYGDARIDVDVLDLDDGGTVRGRVSNRFVCDLAGANCLALNDVIMATNTGDPNDTNALNDGVAINRHNNSDTAQSGEWYAYFSGPNGEEIVGYIVIEGQLADNDPFYLDEDELVTGREIGGFIGTR